MSYYKKIKKVSKIIYLNTDNASYVDTNRKEFTFRIPTLSVEDKSMLYMKHYSTDYRASGVQSLNVIAGTGTNSDACFVSPPSISFISATGTGATASAYMKPTAINGSTASATASATITVVNAGAGYCDTAPIITVNNTGTNGTGCAITSTLSGGTISALSVSAVGKGYSLIPTYTIPAPQATLAVTANVVKTNDTITGLTVTNASTNGFYNATPTLTFNHEQIPAVVTYSSSATGVISSLTLTNASTNGFYGVTPPTITFPVGTHIGRITAGTGGAGYRTAPTVTVVPDGTTNLGSGAIITASVSGGAVSGYTFVSQGTGYTGTPTLLISPPNIERAVVYFNTNSSGTITGFTVANGGGFYSSNPAFSIPTNYNGASPVVPVVNITLSNGAVTVVTLSSGGTGYLPNLVNANFIATLPTSTQATATCAIGGTGATATCTLTSGRIATVTLSAAGSGYLTGTGLLATVGALVAPTAPTGITATISAGRITGFTGFTTAGSGYINTVTLSVSGGTTAPIQAVGGRLTLLATSVSYIKLHTVGYGYTSPPVVLFEAPPTSYVATTSIYLDANASPPLITATLGKEQEGNRMVIKLRNVIYNTASYYNSDGGGDPTIGVGYINGVEMDDDQAPISIPAQTIDNLTLIFSDKYGNGIGNSKVNVAISIEELDEEDRTYIDMKRQSYSSSR